ncbi:hypothetical protein COT12_00560 [Candidatus Berkelbacteria bacterium CG08_land_8_20_14_0_20_39_8]|uniref:Glycosyltransferase family 1 protein n=1 Tax=Candidatus Berkelbacteria bacterium CG08_land_8_20_14_0_20_39_8 TaxID=1974511 RepID=A0A2M6YCX3_9BACT|nr:MAG: hypothetical protein COT12_00560 [Candidatus Berkelbacteria bacterium CG08_land_8_20_14_0_20_39_8]
MTSNKSILLVAWFFYPKLGGAEMIVLNQARYLRDSGYDVSVLTSTVKGLEADDSFDGIKIFRRDFINSSVSYPADEIVANLEKIFARTEIKIVHFHNGSYPAASTDMYAGAENIKTIYEFARLHNCKVVEHSHNAQLKDPVATKQLRELDWDCVICVSNFVKQKWIEFGNQAKDLRVVYNGIDLSKFNHVQADPSVDKLRLTIDGKLIFFPARVVSMTQGAISKQKNFILLLAACKKLLELGITNFRLIAILNESEKEQKTRKANRVLGDLLCVYDLGDHITFIPTVMPDDMPKMYAAVDIICVPSLYETFGLVYIETMASGKVAIASNTGGPTEYIKNGKNGFIVDPNSPDDLSEILYEVLTDEKLNEKIRRNGLATAKKFSVETMMTKIEAIYKKLLEEK